MKALKTIVLVVLLLPIALVLAAFLLPSTYRVERSQLIKAPSDAVFAQINTLKTWPEWTAWTVARYPDMKVSFEGPDSGVGATYSWDGKSSGQGVLKLTRAEPGKGVWYDLDFDHGKFKSTGGLILEPAGDSVKVTWFNEGNLGANPVSRYFGLMMDKMMGPDFATGLLNLKQKVEAKP